MLLCRDCVYYVEDKNKSYCEQDEWVFIDKSKSKLFNPFMFECINFEPFNPNQCSLNDNEVYSYA